LKAALGLVAAAGLLAAGGSARADGEVHRNGGEELRLEIDDCPIRPDVDDAKLRDLASEHYERGAVLYTQGDYDGAVAEFVESYCLAPYYTVLKDIGQAHERQLRYDLAIAYLERYVLAVPAGAPHADDDKESASARIQVLEDLPSQIRVATSPRGGQVTFSNDTGVRAEGHADGPLIPVVAGHYQMAVSLPGYATVTRAVDIGVGEPYSFVVPLARLRGRVRIRTVPPDARIFVDDRLVGLGSWEDTLPAGRYTVSVEAQGRVTDKRKIEVAPGADLPVTVRLRATPASGRLQLELAAGLAGGVSGVSVGYSLEDKHVSTSLIGGLAGTGIGLLGAYFGAPDDITTGSSSYMITSSLIGYVEGAAGTAAFSDDNQLRTAIGTVGLFGGATFAALTAERFHINAGDAALLNSGALWGGVSGGLFAVAFGLPKRLSGGMVLGGLNAGVVAGALLGRRYDISRRHAALIDLSGLAGMAVSVSIEGAIDSGRTTAAPKERVAHFALGGMAVGLIAGVYLTNNLDAPKVPHMAPKLTTMRDAAGNDVVGVGVDGWF
jgi:PEGA domain